jgi:hypothetical protein
MRADGEGRSASASESGSRSRSLSLSQSLWMRGRRRAMLAVGLEVVVGVREGLVDI